MSTWLDVVAFVVTFSVIGAAIWGITIASKQIKESVQSTKETLKSKGLDISGEGISVKTSRRFDRGDYVDATQRGFIKAMSASSFGSTTPDSPGPGRNTTPPVVSKTVSEESLPEDKKKKGAIRRAFTMNKEGK